MPLINVKKRSYGKLASRVQNLDHGKRTIITTVQKQSDRVCSSEVSSECGVFFEPSVR